MTGHQAIAPRLADEPRWTERVVELGTSLFAGTEPAWFEASFLAPELKANEKLSGLASAFRSKDADAVRGIIDGLARDAVPDVDKTSLSIRFAAVLRLSFIRLRR